MVDPDDDFEPEDIDWPDPDTLDHEERGGSNDG